MDIARARSVTYALEKVLVRCVGNALAKWNIDGVAAEVPVSRFRVLAAPRAHFLPLPIPVSLNSPVPGKNSPYW